MYLSEREVDRESDRVAYAIPPSVRSRGKGRRRRSEECICNQCSVISVQTFGQSVSIFAQDCYFHALCQDFLVHPDRLLSGSY